MNLNTLNSKRRVFIATAEYRFDTDFLRFMLWRRYYKTVLPQRESLRIEWIDNKSHANRYDVCLYSGMSKESGISSWLDYSSIHEAADHGALNLKQDVRLVNEITKLGVHRFLELAEGGCLEMIGWSGIIHRIFSGGKSFDY
ncbi:hypothetical protein ABU162_17055 [Paenibacillus thiaminolyticus]|uniref:hypothetical protein n=1 Tax=Paenibacillus thiaminolyticus TaxID=49283 RepID=UPI0035A74741